MTPATLRRVYRREARLMLLLARLALLLVPPMRLFAWADRPPRRVRRFAADEARWVAWAVESEGARAQALCLPRALAAQAMLRRRGIASRLCLGVTHEWRDRSACLGGDRRRQDRRRQRGGGLRAPGRLWRLGMSAIAGLRVSTARR